MEVLLKETFLYGRLDAVYNNEEIKNINIKNLDNYKFPRFKYDNLKYNSTDLYIYDIGWEWRFYCNILCLLDSHEYEIVTGGNKIKQLFMLINNVIVKLSKKIFQIKLIKLIMLKILIILVLL